MNSEELIQIKNRFRIIGNAPALDRAIDVAVQVAPTDLSVLVTGESGTGKEVFPQIIHQFSRRKFGPYQPLNCAAIPEGTIDSELFGHEKGAFTGAIADRKGYFEVADGGTIFLDEVAELPLSTQSRLLRVLETGEFIKVGSSKVLKTDVRVVAATNQDMGEAIRNGRFRADLYYRLNAISVKVPPLRERPDDILRLFRHFTSALTEKYAKPEVRLSDDARHLLQHYRWPGNIRELRNLAERVAGLLHPDELTADDLKEYLDADIHLTPALVALGGNDQDFSTEREILYKVLFDMKKDIRDLKALVNHLMDNRPVETAPEPPSIYSLIDEPPRAERDVPVSAFAAPSHASSDHVLQPSQIQPAPSSSFKKDKHIHDASEYVEEARSLEDMEKDAIVKALERNNGRRRNAAADLNISERTLYRKIRSYGLD